MISYLEGTLFRKDSGQIIVLINGVGYQIFISFQTFCVLPETGKTLSLEIFHHVKEDRNELYGFSSLFERQIFEKLISIGGIGPRTALGIMSPHPAPQLESAIENEDVVFLTKIPGIGKKTAQRIVLELKGKLNEVPRDESVPEVSTLGEEAVFALVNLGYKKSDVEKIISNILKANPESHFEDLLKAAFEALS